MDRSIVSIVRSASLVSRKASLSLSLLYALFGRQMDVAFNAFHFWREQYHVVGKQGLALCLSKETERKEGGTTEGLLGL